MGLVIFEPMEPAEMIIDGFVVKPADKELTLDEFIFKHNEENNYFMSRLGDQLIKVENAKATKYYSIIYHDNSVLAVIKAEEKLGFIKTYIPIEGEKYSVFHNINYSSLQKAYFLLDGSRASETQEAKIGLLGIFK